jgi:hypothetical protein
MATAAKSMPYDSNPGNYNVWADAISTSFGTFGWVQTSDTGQITTAVIASITNVQQVTTTATITTAAAHGLSIGSQIGIANLSQTTLNGCWVVATVPTSTTFTFTLTSGSIASVASTGQVVPLFALCSVTNVSQTTTTATLTYATGPVPVTGDAILVTGLSSTSLNGSWTVASVPSATTLTYTVPTGTISSTPETGIVWSMTPGTTSGSANGVLGYQIWKMGDTLQSTAPCYLKIEFGRSSSGNCPRLAVTTGTSTNGSGTVTGTTSSRTYFSAGTTGTGATTQTCYFAGNTNYFYMTLWQSTAGLAASAFAIERDHDNNGNDLGTYYTMMASSGGSSVWTLQSMFPGLATQTVQETSLNITFPGTTLFNSNVWFAPIFPVIGQIGNQMFCGCCKSSAVTNLSTISVNFYGASHTLICFSNSPFTSFGSVSSPAWCMRYE